MCAERYREGERSIPTQGKRERCCGRRRWKTKGYCGCEGVVTRVWQGVLREMGSRRTCYCDWEKERWRERGKGEQERRQRARKTRERDRERELRCVIWRIRDLEWVGSGDMRMGERDKAWEFEIERDKAWVLKIERDKAWVLRD